MAMPVLRSRIGRGSLTRLVTAVGRSFMIAAAITNARQFEAESRHDCGDDFRLAADDPAVGVGLGQRLERQWLAERADDLCRTNFLVLEHSVRPV